MENIENYLAEILNVPREELQLCSSQYQSLTIAKNEFLLREGEVCQNTFFVEKGLLRMYSTDKNGKEHIIQFAPESWMISDRSSLFFDEKSKYFIEAVEDSEVLLLSKAFFSDLAARFPHTAMKNDQLLQKHIRNLQNRVHSLLADTAEERYLTFIKMYPDIMKRVPQWMVASYLGITPESLSRVRKELVRKKN